MSSNPRTKVMLVDLAPGIGGAERVTLGALSSTGSLDLTVAGTDAVTRFAADLGIETVEFRLGALRGVKDRWRLLLGGLALKRAATRAAAEVVYANSSRAIGYAIAARVLGGPPVIAHNHEVMRQGGLLQAMNAFASVVIVPSRAAGESLIGNSKLRVVPTGIDLERFVAPKSKADAKSRLGLDPRQVVVGTIGRADPVKGAMEFVRIAQLVAGLRPEIQFLLGGGATFPHEHAHYSHITEEARKMGDKIRLLGVVADPVPIYQSLDLFVHLAAPESLPTVAIEAAACGVPALAFAGGGIDEIILDGKTGRLVAQGDLPRAAETLIELTDDLDTLALMGRGARELAETRFDINRFVEDLTQIIVATAGG